MSTSTSIPTPLAELLRSQQEEIAKHKWIESQRKGYDIGWQQATQEWFEQYLVAWSHDQRRLIDEALNMTDEALGMTSDSKVQELQAA